MRSHLPPDLTGGFLLRKRLYLGCFYKMADLPYIQKSIPIIEWFAEER